MISPPSLNARENFRLRISDCGFPIRNPESDPVNNGRGRLQSCRSSALKLNYIVFAATEARRHRDAFLCVSVAVVQIRNPQSAIGNPQSACLGQELLPAFV